MEKMSKILWKKIVDKQNKTAGDNRMKFTKSFFSYGWTLCSRKGYILGKYSATFTDANILLGKATSESAENSYILRVFFNKVTNKNEI